MKRTIFAGLIITLSAASLMAQLKIKSKAEGDAVMALQTASQGTDPDATIKAADALISKFADTEFKPYALYLEANAYRQKKDDDRAQILAEQVTQADPKDYRAPLLVGELIVTHTRENDLDKEEKLTKAEKNLNLCIENTKAAVKPNTQIPDAQWEEVKTAIIAEAQADLGRVYMQRKKYDAAIPVLQAASAADPQPAYFVWLASSQQLSGKNDEAIATCDKVLAQPDQNPAIKQAATGIRADAVKAKGGK